MLRGVFDRIEFLWRILGQTLSSWTAFVLSYVRPRQAIKDIWRSQSQAFGGNVVVFVHFDLRGKVADHTLRYLRSFRDSGFDIAFVTNAGWLKPEALATLKSICKVVIIRKNVGYDFGAVRDTLIALKLEPATLDRLIIANDSVYDLTGAVQTVLRRVDFNRADVFGATESWQHNYHLQSYFLVISPRALADPSWSEFWTKVRQVSSKAWVVSHYEVGLTRCLTRAGLRCEALWPYQHLLDAVTNGVMDQLPEDEADPLQRMRLVAAERIRLAIANRVALNPTAELWRHLLMAGFPFLKVELLKRNPGKVVDIADWRKVIGCPANADHQLIEDDLKGHMRGRAP